MGPQSESHQALVRHAASIVLMVLTIAGGALVLWSHQLYKLWASNFSGLTYFDLIFYPMFVVASLNGIFYAVRLVTWGRTVHEQTVTSKLPLQSKIEIPVIPSVPLRVIIFVRSKHTLFDVTGTIKILGAGSSAVMPEKRLAGKQGTNAKIVILSVSREQKARNIVVEAVLDWRPYALGRNRDRDFIFDLIVRAKT